MEPDWWARGIAIGSATATSLNMFISFRTYRRVRPKLVMHEDIKRREDGVSYYVRLFNPGTTAIQPLQLTLYFRRSRWPILGPRTFPALAPQAMGRDDIGVDEIKPLGAAEILFHVPGRVASGYQMGRLTYMQLALELPNGKVLYGKNFKCPPYPYSRTIPVGTGIIVLARRDHQLSFDDLEED